MNRKGACRPLLRLFGCRWVTIFFSPVPTTQRVPEIHFCCPPNAPRHQFTGVKETDRGVIFPFPPLFFFSIVYTAEFRNGKTLKICYRGVKFVHSIELTFQKLFS